ncbi:MAG: enoyl-CoA hydratase/isomerase family protein [Pyrinomonadaceae bacterium]|nr:enoyl-CoA hydratase/isomerase family protein [Pyrinomonadaceae bacterium]MBP6211974.1 enoyl-CoA hydratase/isomerase family protein [Pyrinomonadaceae bacterium]
MSDELDIEYRDGAVVVRFIRPGIRNPLSVSVLRQLHTIVDNLSDESPFDRIVFTGMEDIFASGADLREIAAVRREDAREFALRGQTLMTKISQLQITAIAAVNGFCFGGALDLALACDKRFASPTALFSHPGAGLGIITGWGGTQRLPRLVGEATALEMLFTGMRMTAAEAINCGLIDLLSDDPLAEALGFGTI